MGLNIRSADECEFDQVSLGECMIRLSPQGHGRVEFANMLEDGAWQDRFVNVEEVGI